MRTIIHLVHLVVICATVAVGAGCNSGSSSLGSGVDAAGSTGAEPDLTEASLGNEGQVVTDAGDETAVVTDAGDETSIPMEAGHETAGPIDPRLFWKDVAIATCDQFWRCTYPDDDQLLMKIVMGTRQRCEQLELQVLVTDYRVRTLIDAVLSGTIRYRPERASACLDAIRVCGTGARFTEFATCREVFDGSVATGGAC